jgi:hypothetical protein
VSGSYSKLVPLAYKIAGGSVANLTTDRFDAENWLLVVIRISGYAGSAIAQLQFNGDTGTTAYASRVSNNFAAATTQVSGVASGIKVSQTATTNPRALIKFMIGNVSGRAHGIVYQGSDLSESAATAPDIIIGSGIWTTTSQITQITLNDGGSNLLSGTDITVWGLAGTL